MNQKSIAFLQELLVFHEKKDNNPSTINKIRDSYYDLSAPERKEIIATLCNLGNQYTLLSSLSLLLCNKEDDCYLLGLLMKNVIISDLEPNELLKYFIQCRYLVFQFFPELRNDLISIYKKMYDESIPYFSGSWNYIEYKSRHKNKILILTNQLLSERHAPTQLIINQWFYLTQLGYNVEIMVVSENHIEKPKLWNAFSIRMMNPIEQKCRFSKTYYEKEIDGYNLFLESSNYKNTLIEAVALIREYNPEFILSMGDMSIVADIVAKFTTVVVSNFSKDFPITMSKFVIFNNTSNENIKNTEKCIFQYQYAPILIPKEIGNSDLIERLSQENRFKILIVGNRLDSEIEIGFENQLNKLIDECPNILYIIVGECEQFENRIIQSSYSEQYIFVGFTNNLPGITRECDIYLNPPRSGGGFSSRIALSYGLPVITLGECDVSSWAGPDFICNDIQSLFDEIKKCYDSINYKSSKSQLAIERWNHISSTENEGIKNTKEFVNHLTYYIKIYEDSILLLE